MIVAENIRKSFGDVEVLKGVNISVNKGEIVSVVGASGAGKTTLLQILGTLLRADSGKIIIDTIETAALNEKQLSKFRNKKIGFVFQFHHLLPEFTALENVCIPGFIARRSRKEVETYAKELLEILNLSHRLTHKPDQLSGGEKQRVAIARALINNPSVVFADEPSGNLDSQNTRELYELFFMLREKFNQTFIIVTHNDELARNTDRLFYIKDGIIEG
ncbi:MAG: lipoprotein ABC transporter ATP-binding protein [Bacteroidetes bacterium RIFOXYB2_FULL_35_7]|nr:MAG: lipoprotein ABC transporter ATP-binding protein [Bacteroidetes bacterium GWF2_35_48]OFY93674.1 MAG: lipoprotein ABC transporter ATP-binding protein [Bacteroidetes bacterium RIFOXYC12_FULL_35_7]OFY96388.1 MAG: lipoprotein ABC transporter ATP-binding protein [Bacteroidetes bacterium RIFOXYB2_FULL_35_7]HBX50261.1 lipoprotein-releasing system ATP-binding protein LolD [Bacteroidales bacterium]